MFGFAAQNASCAGDRPISSMTWTGTSASLIRKSTTDVRLFRHAKCNRLSPNLLLHLRVRPSLWYVRSCSTSLRRTASSTSKPYALISSSPVFTKKSLMASNFFTEKSIPRAERDVFKHSKGLMASLAGINLVCETTRTILRGGSLGSILAVIPPTDSFRFMLFLVGSCRLYIVVSCWNDLIPSLISCNFGFVGQLK